MENIMNNSKKSMTAFCTASAVARPVMTFAASGVIELETVHFSILCRIC